MLLEKIIQLHDIKKVYKMGSESIYALNGVTLDFYKGKIYCLLGTSGSGKSTLLNMIAGLEKPTSGTIVFHNQDLHHMNENQLALFRQKYIGFIFQSYNLLATLTALENVALPLIFRKVKKRERNRMAYRMLKAVGLENRVEHRPSEMSGGQQQRVSIARAFVNKPQVVFADEPTGNLDTRTTYEMMNLIVGLARSNEQTLIIVTHDLEISQYADCIIKIRDGNVYDIEEVKEPLIQKDLGQNNEDMVN